MSLVASIPNHDNSPWYTKMENRANLWKKYASENGLEINGHYNAHIVEFKITGNINDNSIKIKGFRQLTNITTVLIPMNGGFSEKFTVNLNSNRIRSKYFLHITKKGFFDFLKRKLDHNISVGKYLVSYNSNSIIDIINNSKILESENIVSLSIDKKGLKMTLKELPETSQKVTNIKRLWEQTYS